MHQRDLCRLKPCKNIKTEQRAHTPAPLRAAGDCKGDCTWQVVCLSYSVPPHPLMSGFGEHVLTRANSSASLSVSLSHFRFLAASSLLLSRPNPCRPPPFCSSLSSSSSSSFPPLLIPHLFFHPFSYLRPHSLCCLSDAEQTICVRCSSIPNLYAFSYSSTNYIIMNINLNYTLPSCLRPGLHRPREGGRERDFMMRYCP